MMVEMSEDPLSPAPVRFQADHPFLYFIRDPLTGLVLTAGRVVDPRDEANRGS
jgi:serpin B